MPARPVQLRADPVRLAQIVENLLTNASKYTDAGGAITVRVTDADDAVGIEVRDTGIGIDPEHLPVIFELFTQVNTSMDRSRGGLGIGLALVRRLVELHGGTVRCASDGVGRGSSFVVRLPRGERADGVSPG
jgi:signal transduction histidine kinase